MGDAEAVNGWRDTVCVVCIVCVCIRYQHLIYTAFADRMNEFQSTQKREHVFYFHVMLNDFYKKVGKN